MNLHNVINKIERGFAKTFERDIFSPNISVGFDPKCDRSPFAQILHSQHSRVIGIEDSCAAILHPSDKLSLCGRNVLDRPKMLNMHRQNVQFNRNIGRRYPA